MAIGKHNRIGSQPVLRSLFRDDSGQDLIEYALILMFIALVAIATLTTLRNAVSNRWSILNSGLGGQ